MAKFSLEDLFFDADIDDLTEEDGITELVFTMRYSQGEKSFRIQGSDLDDALEQAQKEINRFNVMEGLRREGLTDEDIDRLAAGGVDEIVEEAWNRGYVAGATEVAHYLPAPSDPQPSDYRPAPIVSAPAMAMAAEPTEPVTSLDHILSAPGALEALVGGDGLAITLALIHPAKIVLA